MLEDSLQRRTLAMPIFLQERHATLVDEGRLGASPALHDQIRPLQGLRKAREAAGLTVAELALRTGLTTNLLGLLESRDHAPSPRTWQALARALDVEPAVLLEAPAMVRLPLRPGAR